MQFDFFLRTFLDEFISREKYPAKNNENINIPRKTLKKPTESVRGRLSDWLKRNQGLPRAPDLTL